VSRSLSINQEAVISLQETSFKLSHLQEEHSSLQWQLRECEREKNQLEERVFSAEERLQKREERVRRSGEEHQRDLEAAAELAEKQNALTMTLEAKVGCRPSSRLRVGSIHPLCLLRSRDFNGIDN
jgi:septal ring factor EnvC (AmiA/AmiB activator)